MTTAGTYIRFEEATPNAKTKVWRVVTKDGDILLGQISWFGRWRGYAFHANMTLPNLIFEHRCLDDLSAFIKAANQAHRSKA